MGIVPVVNENDSIATEEIKYGDNDRLASRVAQISSADCLILLSDVDGMFSKDPKIYPDAKLIKEIKNIDEKLKNVASKNTGVFGSGGMATKIDAAKICQNSGCYMAIASGLVNRPLHRIIKKNICTWFLPKISKLASISPKGELIVDDGAIAALKNGKSLLAAGIKKVNGKFNKGDHLKILDKNYNEYARGLSSFASQEISKIKGQHSKNISVLLGYSARSEVIHKDDMVEF